MVSGSSLELEVSGDRLVVSGGCLGGSPGDSPGGSPSGSLGGCPGCSPVRSASELLKIQRNLELFEVQYLDLHQFQFHEAFIKRNAALITNHFMLCKH